MVEGEQPRLEISTSRHFSSWLAGMGAALSFTTYQAGKLFMLGTKPDGKISLFERTVDRCMGLVAQGSSLYVSSLYQIWRFENAMRQGESKNEFDACFVPQMSYVTGDLDVHDLALDAQGDLVFVNTLFSCLAKPSFEASFIPLWQPPFLSKLAAEDRCHLNGMAMGESGPEYVTAISESDVADGWSDNRVGGGIVMHVPSNEVVVRGLSMPHSPRLKGGKLYILNSGTGEFGTIDLQTGTFIPIAFCPGYARGLTFIDDYAVIGTSLSRNDKAFSGLPLDEVLKNKNTQARCGLMVVDLKTGDIVHWVRIEGIVTELYDIAVLKGCLNPSVIGFQTDEIRKVIKIGPSP